MSLRVVVTGGRDYADEARVFAELDRLDIGFLAHGGARGADRLAGKWAAARGKPAFFYLPRWEQGKKAGVLRNIEMLDDFKPDLVVAFPGGKGTAHCVSEARRRGIPVRLIPEGT